MSPSPDQHRLEVGLAESDSARAWKGAAPLERPSRVSLLDLLLIILNRKRFLAGWMLAISVSAVAISMLMTSYYTATTVVLPSKQNMGTPLGSLMGDMPLGGLLKSFDFLGGEDNSRFLSILDSRRMADRVIGRFDLIKRYGFHKKKKYYYETVLKEYHKNFQFEEDQLGNIRIAVTDTNPKHAAEMANYVVDMLDSISYQIAQQDARGSRMFFEERVRLMNRSLDSVHHALAKFQVENNFIDLEQQVKSSIEALAGVEAEAIAADIEKDLLASNFGSNSRIAEVQKKKDVLNRRMKDYMQKGSGSLVLPLKKTPEMGIKYAYLYRDVKVHEALYAFLLQMYEQAKFREANNSPVVSVLERAMEPQKRTRPRRAVICLAAFFIGFAVVCCWILFSHWLGLQRSQGTETYAKIARIRAHFRPGR